MIEKTVWTLQEHRYGDGWIAKSTHRTRKAAREARTHLGQRIRLARLSRRDGRLHVRGKGQVI